MSTENLSEIVDHSISVNNEIADDSFQINNDEKLNSNVEEVFDTQEDVTTNVLEEENLEVENNNADLNNFEVTIDDTEENEESKINDIEPEDLMETETNDQFIVNDIETNDTEETEDIETNDTEQIKESKLNDIEQEDLKETETNYQLIVNDIETNDTEEIEESKLNDIEQEDLKETETNDQLIVNDIETNEKIKQDCATDEEQITNEPLTEEENAEKFEESQFTENINELELNNKRCDEIEFKEEISNESQPMEDQFDQNKPMNGDKIDEIEKSSEYINGEKPQNVEKVSETRQSNEIKALSSSYNNDENVNSNCEICTKVVYPLEKISENSRVFHKQCFRCTKCRCTLSAGNFSFNSDKPYCRVHFIELFKKRGRYDETGDYETTATNINDILTDELPATDVTKNLVAKFKHLESHGVSAASVTGINSETTSEMPAPNTTKSLTERFSALGKDNDHQKKESTRKPMIDLPRAADSGHCENEPASLSKDVHRANEPAQDEMPEQGITKNLVNRFRGMETAGVVSK